MKNTTHTRKIQPSDVLRRGDEVIDANGWHWHVLESEGGWLTVLRPDGDKVRMQSSQLFSRARKLVRS